LKNKGIFVVGELNTRW